MEGIVEKMREEDVPFDTVTFGTLATAYSKNGEHDKLRDLLAHMKDDKNCRGLNASFYSIIASTFNRIGDLDAVDDAWDDLITSRLFPDTDVYNNFLSLYGRRHNLSRMQNVLEYMLRQVPPNPITATTVVDMLGKSGKIAEMERLLLEMRKTEDAAPTV
eukprot:gene4085-14548_t